MVNERAVRIPLGCILVRKSKQFDQSNITSDMAALTWTPQWVNGPYYFIKIGQNSLQTCKRTGGAGEFIAPELEQLAGLLAAVTVSGDGVVSRCRDSMKGISCWLVSHNSPRKSNFSFIISSKIRNGSILLTRTSSTKCIKMNLSI